MPIIVMNPSNISKNENTSFILLNSGVFRMFSSGCFHGHIQSNEPIIKPVKVANVLLLCFDINHFIDRLNSKILNT